MVPTVWLANVMLVGERLTAGAAAAVAVPLSETCCGLAAALSVNVIAPVSVPAAVGVKVIEMVQFAGEGAVPPGSGSTRRPAGKELVVDRLSEARAHGADLDAVAVVDDDGRLLGDVSVLDILLALRASTDTRMSALLGDEDVVTANPHTSANEAAAQLVEARRHSMVVVDDDGCPLGRILADDVLDALVPTKGRFHFPRLLS